MLFNVQRLYKALGNRSVSHLAVKVIALAPES